MRTSIRSEGQTPSRCSDPTAEGGSDKSSFLLRPGELTPAGSTPRLVFVRGVEMKAHVLAVLVVATSVAACVVTLPHPRQRPLLQPCPRPPSWFPPLPPRLRLRLRSRLPRSSALGQRSRPCSPGRWSAMRRSAPRSRRCRWATARYSRLPSPTNCLVHGTRGALSRPGSNTGFVIVTPMVGGLELVRVGKAANGAISTTALRHTYRPLDPTPRQHNG